MATPGPVHGVGPVSFRVNQSRPGAAFQLDELSKQIIEKLQEDGRRSYAGIGKAVGLHSSSTVHTHLANLEKAGVLRRDPTKPRAIELLIDRANKAVMPANGLPLLGQVAAGSPILADENARQLVITAYIAGFGIAQLFFGPLSDRFGRRTPLLLGLAVYVAAALGAAFAPSFETLLILRFVQGLGAAGTRVITVSVVRDAFGGRAMAEVMSLVFMVFMVIPVIAPGIGQIVMLFSEWHMIFVVMALFALAWNAIAPQLILSSVLADPAAADLPPFGMQRQTMLAEARAVAAGAAPGVFNPDARPLIEPFRAAMAR